MSNWNKKPHDEKIYRWTEFFTSWTSEKCTRARVQENKSIYLSIYLSVWKPFWKRVYIYIYIYIYIYSNVWFQCKTSECLVSFKFLSMSCMGSFQWPFHYKKLLLSNKNICWATSLCSCDLFVSFSRAVNYIFFRILIVHCTVVLVYKTKNNDDFIKF